MNELALFAGAGGGILGGHLLGWRCVCAVEINKYARNVLLARQRDGHLPRFPIWDDICTFDGSPWRGVVDVVSGGFPCQDISSAGKGAGIDGARSGLWREMARIVGEVRPRFVFVENSPLLVGRGLAVVLGDLAKIGYDSVWDIVSAAECGAPHRRERLWALAYATGSQLHDAGPRDDRARRPAIRSCGGSPNVAYANGMRELQPQGSERDQWGRTSNSSWWSVEPDVGRVANGVASRVDRLKAIGNGQVPIVAATAFRHLYEMMASESSFFPT